MDALAPGSVAAALLAWAQRCGRHDLPWQLDTTPYRIWVSEVMLQQTQVATVIPYYERFVARFPDVTALAAASLDEVLHVWTGLGYYARARNLHRAARMVVDHHGGCLPDDIDTLQTLPGIGRSTAGAILTLSHGQRHPILDGNVRRVLTRVFAVDGAPTAAETLKHLWALADACTPEERVAEYTQGIMDLGAGVCLRSRPRCEPCPLSDLCVAHLQNREHKLPSRRRRPARPRRTVWALVVRDSQGSLLLQQRASNGIWGGLWSLPQFESERDATAWLVTHLPGASTLNPLETQHHTFTHYDLEMRLHTARIDAHQPESAAWIWFDPKEARPIGLTKAVTNVIATLM